MISAFLLTTWSMKPGSWWEKPLWSWRQTCEREQVVERGDRPAPGDLAGHLQPLGVLVEHRVDDVDEGLVAVEEAVAAGEQVALEPALAVVLGEHLHAPGRRARGGRRSARISAPRRRGRSPRRRPRAGWRRSRRVRRGGSWCALRVDHVAQEGRRARGSPRRASRPGVATSTRVVAEVGQREVAQQQAAVGVRVGAHAPVALGRQRGAARRRGRPSSSKSSSGR